MKSGDRNLSLNKRRFLQGVGAIAALSILPEFRGALAQEQWDLIVVGAGTAGLPCALFAAQRGARVLVIERSHLLGGTLDRSSGQMSAAGTKLQAKLGIKDSTEAHFEDVMRISKGTVDPEIARLAVENATFTVDWLTDRGLQVLDGHPLKTGGHEPYMERRYQWAQEAGIAIRKVLMPEIEKQVANGNIKFLIRTDAVELIQDAAGAVVGVVAQGPDGRRVDYGSRTVVLTTGGCGGNPDMYQQLHSVPLYGRMAYPYNLGGGLTMGLAAGGYLRGGEKYTTLFGSVLRDTAIPSVPAGVGVIRDPLRRQPWEVYVNGAGERFVEEDNKSVDYREHALLAQPGHRYWIVFDDEVLEKSPPIVRGWDKARIRSAFDKYHFFARANSLGELAYWAGIDAAGLEATIVQFNQAIAQGNDNVFRRQHMPLPVRKPPFYAIRMQGTQILTFAGLGIDKQLRVIREDGRPIENLYAAGEVIGAGATTGNALVNGMALTPALTFGRMIGQNVPVAS
jgi:fumarate reductase flavoprotein subunit